jgi:hypothetical protein
VADLVRDELSTVRGDQLTLSDQSNAKARSSLGRFFERILKLKWKLVQVFICLATVVPCLALAAAVFWHTTCLSQDDTPAGR